MAFTEKYVSTTGAGTNTGLSEANAFTWAQMVTNINAGSGAGCRYNIKANATYSLASGDDMGGVGGTTTSPIVLRGYKTTIGDGYLGRDAVGALITTNMPLIHYTSNGSLRTFNQGVIESLNVLASARDDFTINLNYKMGCIGCRIENSYNNSSSGALRLEEATVVFECDILMTGGGGSGRAVAEFNGQIIRLDSCRITTTTANAICVKGSYGCGLFGCLIKGPGTGSGIYFDGSNPCCNIRNCTITGWTDGVKFNNSISEHPNWICGNMITDNAGYGVNFTTGSMETIIGPNRVRDNVLGDTNNAAQNWLQSGRIIPLVTTDTGGAATDYVNVATNDYNLIPASPAKGQNIPRISDMGAYGLADPSLVVVTGSGANFRFVSPIQVGVGYSPGAGGQIASDTFDTYANGAPLGSQAGWTSIGVVTISKPAAAGQVYANHAGGTPICRSTGVYAENQYSEIVMGTVTVGHASGIGVAVAINTSGVYSFYGVEYYASPAGSESLYLLKYLTGTKTDLANSGYGTVKCVAGDVIRLERTGSGTLTRLTVKKNGTAVTGLTNINPGTVYIPGGAAGIYGDGNPGAVYAASWAGGNL